MSADFFWKNIPHLLHLKKARFRVRSSQTGKHHWGNPFCSPKASRTAKHEGPSAACRIITVNWGPWGAVTRGAEGLLDLVGKRETRMWVLPWMWILYVDLKTCTYVFCLWYVRVLLYHSLYFYVHVESSRYMTRTRIQCLASPQMPRGEAGMAQVGELGNKVIL